eukprot:TRINITY_DN2772_c0_g1_i2.p1 TRINITY_DN2772_c0_g1~~TRINITY_DN2772_c0_g1_i2.p1  ORF type:complete len:416 (-),score=79.53 TRINITY_DN2772_c0_g1_i2:42-1223(-)
MKSVAANVFVVLLALFHCNPTVALQSPPHRRPAALNAQLANATTQKKRPVVLIMMQAIHWTWYMYEPAFATLREGFENGPQDVEVRIPTPVRANEPGSTANLVAEFNNQTASLGRGDIIIYMGLIGPDVFARQVPKLRAQGIYTVFYSADPTEGCQMDATQVDEIWDFSHQTIRNCAKRGCLKTKAPAPPQRFVPLGALETPRVTYNPDSAEAKAAGQKMNFFGHVAADRQKCFAKLDGMIGEKNLKLERTSDVWADSGFKALLNTTDLFLNMNHRCDMNEDLTDDDRQPVFWRVPKLINAHGLVISEPCWPEDQAEFEGMVDFVPFSKIPEKFAELSALPASERQRLGNERAELFAKKFEPKKILERASIFSLMTCLQDPNCDPKTTVPAKA